MKTLKKQLEERLNSIEDAYTETGEDRIDFSVFPENKRAYKEAQYNIEIIVEAARKIERECGMGDIDWNDHKQWKYIPWFRMSPGAFAFGDSSCVDSSASAGSGSRLRVLSVEASNHIGKTFPDIWKAVQLL